MDANAAIGVTDGPKLSVALPGMTARDGECRACCCGVLSLCPLCALLVGAYAATIGAVDTLLSLARRVGDPTSAEGALWRVTSIDRAAGGRVTWIGRRRCCTREGK